MDKKRDAHEQLYIPDSLTLLFNSTYFVVV